MTRVTQPEAAEGTDLHARQCDRDGLWPMGTSIVPSPASLPTTTARYVYVPHQPSTDTWRKRVHGSRVEHPAGS